MRVSGALVRDGLLVVAVRWQVWVSLMVSLFAGGWLLEGAALSSVAERRWFAVVRWLGQRGRGVAGVGIIDDEWCVVQGGA